MNIQQAIYQLNPTVVSIRGMNAFDVNGNPVTYDLNAAQALCNQGLVSDAIQAALDAGAQQWNYDSIVSAASYATSTNKQYAADATALIGWRDASWAWYIPLIPTITATTVVATFMQGMPAQPTQPVVTS
jgi:hypothetical protein